MMHLFCFFSPTSPTQLAQVVRVDRARAGALRSALGLYLEQSSFGLILLYVRYFYFTWALTYNLARMHAAHTHTYTLTNTHTRGQPTVYRALTGAPVVLTLCELLPRPAEIINVRVLRCLSTCCRLFTYMPQDNPESVKQKPDVCRAPSTRTSK